jgi:uncharacterized membrane protein
MPGKRHSVNINGTHVFLVKENTGNYFQTKSFMLALRLLCVLYIPTSAIAYPAATFVFHRRNFWYRHHDASYPTSMHAIGVYGSLSMIFPRKQNRIRLFSPYQSRVHRSHLSYKFAASYTTGTQLFSVLSTAGILGAQPNDQLLGNVFAACPLALAAWMGFSSERQLVHPLFPSCGIIFTLFVASLLSTFFKCIPTLHSIYDSCWSTMLPGSLALLLLSLPSNPDASLRDKNSKYLLSDNSVSGAVKRLAVPFLLACVGSILGCSLSFVICNLYPTLLLSPFDACQAAACLVASYIGGSVNFFATAAAIRQLQLSKILEVRSSRISHSTLMSAMCAVDILVMAIYFSFLSVALQSQRLQCWFHSGSRTSIASSLAFGDGTTTSMPKQRSIKKLNIDLLSFRVPAVFICGLLALFFVHISKRLESIVNRFIPGTACGFLCTFVPYFTSRVSAIPWIRDSSLWKAIQHYAEPMSFFSFLLLFGSIGITADVSNAVSRGPSCLCFSFIAIVTHGFVTLFGSFLWKRVCFSKTFIDWNNQLDLADVLIASNAAIGGPATAAAFCGQIPEQDSIERKRSLSIAATIWGVVGYAFGTTIGLSLYKFLQYFV